VNPSAPPLYTRAFWIACALHFTGAMSHGMLVLLPLFIRSLGGDELVIGLLLGIGLGVSVVLRPGIGALLDRVGRRRVLVWGSALNTVALPFFCLVRSVDALLVALTILHMAAGGALFAGYFTYAADLVPPARRAEGIAIFGIAGMIPNGLGPALGEVMIARAGYPGFFLAATAFAFVSLVLSALVPGVRPEPHGLQLGVPWTTSGREVMYLLRRGLLPILSATALFGVGVNAAFYFVAPFTRDLFIMRASPFFVAYAGTTVLLRIVGRRLPDRVGPQRIAVPSFGVFAAGLVALCFLPAPGVLVLAGIACGAGHGSLFPILNALTVERTPARLHGIAVSLYTAALDLGGVVGTPLCGAIARGLGYRTMFALTSTTALGGLALMARDLRAAGRRRSVSPPPPA
jgi:MFS family permease